VKYKKDRYFTEMTGTGVAGTSSNSSGDGDGQQTSNSLAYHRVTTYSVSVS
jgi:hypothetical protein